MKKKILFGVEFHYFAIPPEQWADKLHDLQSRAITTIIVSIPWEWHELEENKYEFNSPEYDLPNLLRLCHNLQIAVIIRVGPRVPFYKPSRGIPGWIFT